MFLLRPHRTHLLDLSFTSKSVQKLSVQQRDRETERAMGSRHLCCLSTLLQLLLLGLASGQVLFQVTNEFEHPALKSEEMMQLGSPSICMVLVSSSLKQSSWCRRSTWSRGSRAAGGTTTWWGRSTTSPPPASRTSGCRRRRTPSPAKVRVNLSHLSQFLCEHRTKHLESRGGVDSTRANLIGEVCSFSFLLGAIDQSL